jgi:hypothetical protein
MRNLTKAIAAIALLGLSVPLAQAQSAHSFDGAYEGVSRTVEATGMMNYKRTTCTPDGKPGPLTITNGLARAGAADNPMEGSVNAQGALVMHLQNGVKFEGRVDGAGRATGRLTGGCSYQLVWQKRGR